MFRSLAVESFLEIVCFFVLTPYHCSRTASMPVNSSQSLWLRLQLMIILYAFFFYTSLIVLWLLKLGWFFTWRRAYLILVIENYFRDLSPINYLWIFLEYWVDAVDAFPVNCPPALTVTLWHRYFWVGVWRRRTNRLLSRQFTCYSPYCSLTSNCTHTVNV